jgi:tRNA-dihydrouridine synthase C
VHARTKVEGYKRPAHWHWIAKIKDAINIPVIANGEIWNFEDAMKCREISGCTDIMVGRGALTVPNLGQVIKQESDIMPWLEVLAILSAYTEFETHGDKSKYYCNRIKQWLKYLKGHYQEADLLFDEIRRLQTAEDIRSAL